MLNWLNDIFSIYELIKEQWAINYLITSIYSEVIFMLKLFLLFEYITILKNQYLK